MYEPRYILTTVIPTNGKFKAYFKDIKSGQVKVIERRLTYKKHKNIPLLLQFFLENDTYPLLVYDNKLKPIGIMSFNSFEKIVSERCTTMDIEVLNPSRLPNPEHDEIVCVSYGNKDCVKVRFSGKGEDKIEENYILYFSDERESIERFLGDLAKSEDLVLCGYNISGFDLKYIKKRAELLGVSNEITTHSAKTLYGNRKICLLPNFINIDLLPILQYIDLPSTKLEYVSKIFGLELSKMSIEDLWIYHREKKFDGIIEHNVNRVITTHEVLKRFLNPIYLLAEKTVGTFDYGFYSNLPRNIFVRYLLNNYRRYSIRFEEILKRIGEKVKEFSFDTAQEKIRENLNVKFKGRVEKVRLLDLPIKAAEKLKNYEPVFEEILKTYEKIGTDSIEGKISRRVMSCIVYRILLNRGKKKGYESKIESVIEEIKKGVKGRIYASSRRYLIADGIEDTYSYNLISAILNPKKPKILLANCEGVLIGSIPKRQAGMPEKFYKAFIEDLFDFVLNKPANQMRNMKEKLDRRNLSIDDLKIEVRGVNTSQLLIDSQKNFSNQEMKKDIKERERIYVVKLKKGFLTLEDARKDPNVVNDVDLEYYEKKFSEVWKLYEEMKFLQNSLESFFSR